MAGSGVHHGGFHVERRVQVRHALWLMEKRSERVGLSAMVRGFCHQFQSQAAPRTPEESPCSGGRNFVLKKSEKTC